MTTQKLKRTRLPFLAGVSASATAGILALPLASSLAAPLAAQQSPQTARPNIVVILADDMGYSDIGCFGGEIATPNIDRLRQSGVAFTQFYNQARCCPTRAVLMTGRYPHQVGVGEMIDGYAAKARANANSRSYDDHLSPDSPTMAEVLRSAGYSTMMAGKWHLGPKPSEWPVKRGFDRSFVQIDGAMNYYGGNSGNGPRAPMAIDDKKFVPPHDGFYSTDEFASHIIQFMTDAVTQHPEKPFFVYLPFNAAHWPYMAPMDEIAKYKGKYDAGWQPIRDARLARLKQLGIVPPDQQMAPMDTGKIAPWNKLNAAQHAEWSRLMECYAAVITHMDMDIGKVLATLDKLGVADNTIVLFLQDNGAADEDPNKSEKGSIMGDRDSFRGYDTPWATVSNTPWRRHKTTCYEGGASTPLLVRWPAGIPADKVGAYVRTPAHIIDLLPTFVALSGATYPTTDKLKLEGQDITAMLKGNAGPTDRALFWEHEGYRAVRDGKWKLISVPPRITDPAKPGKDIKTVTGPWELYDEETDRIEQHDLAAQNPDIVKKLAAEYNAWAARCGVIEFSKIAPEGKAGGKAGKSKKGKN